MWILRRNKKKEIVCQNLNINLNNFDKVNDVCKLLEEHFKVISSDSRIYEDKFYLKLSGDSFSFSIISNYKYTEIRSGKYTSDVLLKEIMTYLNCIIDDKNKSNSEII